jgi:hypothetical protein
MSPVVECEAFRIEENVVTEELWLNTGDVMVRLPWAVIKAIRELSARQVPHLRRARKEVFSERSRKGWVTRRSDREDRLVLEDAAAFRVYLPTQTQAIDPMNGIPVMTTA